MPKTLKNQAAIAGIGQTKYSKKSGVSELSLSCQAVSAAIDDAGIRPDEVDGVVT
jgi:3-oxoacyl-[acyl-carrier-protein] synthase III